MFEIVVERIAASEAFDSAAGKRPEPFADIVMSRAEYIAKILGQEFAQPLGGHRSDGFHRKYPPTRGHREFAQPSPKADRPCFPLDVDRHARAKTVTPPSDVQNLSKDDMPLRRGEATGTGTDAQLTALGKFRRGA